jgi:LacI family transcriptional regulator
VATVDHVLNGRAHAREHARKRVEQAIKEIEKQELQLFIRSKLYIAGPAMHESVCRPAIAS